MTRALLLALCASTVLAAPGVAREARPADGAVAEGTRFSCPDMAARAPATSFFDNAVYQGDDGWFFRMRNDVADFALQAPQVVSMMGRLGEAFAARGVTLVYMPVPNRGMTDPHRLPAGIADGVVYDGDMARRQFAALVETFRGAGVPTVDILSMRPADGGEDDFHFARDIHWRPDGARLSAEAVARTLGEVPAFADVTHKAYASQSLGEAELASPMLSALQSLCTDKLAVETLTRFESAPTEISADDLLGGDEETAPPVAIVGTSYSDLPEFNFAGFLAEALQTDVANYAISGGGTFTAILQYTHTALMDGPQPKVLLWENPVGYRLDGQGITLFRQLIPAVRGACPADKALFAADLVIEPGAPARIEVPPSVTAAGHDAYLAMTLSDPRVRNLKLSLDHRDGEGEDVAITRPDRMADTDRVFLELSDDFDAPLQALTVSAPVLAETTLTLTLCKAKGA